MVEVEHELAPVGESRQRIGDRLAARELEQDAVLAQRDEEADEHRAHRRCRERDRDRADRERMPATKPRRRPRHTRAGRAAGGAPGARDAPDGIARRSTRRARCRASTPARARRGTCLPCTCRGRPEYRYMPSATVPIASAAASSSGARPIAVRPTASAPTRRASRTMSPAGYARFVTTAARLPPVGSSTTCTRTAAATAPAGQRSRDAVEPYRSARPQATAHEQEEACVDEVGSRRGSRRRRVRGTAAQRRSASATNQ